MNSSASPARNSPNRGSKKSSFATGGSRFSISTMANGTDHFSATSQRSNKIKNNANAGSTDKNNSTTTPSNGVTTNDTTTSPSSSTPTQQQKNSGRIRRRSAPPVTLEGKLNLSNHKMFCWPFLISRLFFDKQVNSIISRTITTITAVLTTITITTIVPRGFVRSSNPAVKSSSWLPPTIHKLHPKSVGIRPSRRIKKSKVPTTKWIILK